MGVDLRLFEDASIHVTRLAGIASSTRSGEPVALDDNHAYTIEVTGAETWIGWSDLSVLLNEYTFAFDEAPVGDLEIAREEDEDQRDQVELKGDLENVLVCASRSKADRRSRRTAGYGSERRRSRRWTSR
ncbi:MAG TPA: hypothetical protein VEY33_09255 [Gemmatimonadota bacterium]|nr:hypothetical protein [Gemmatimonadota bacterium]